MTTDCWTVVTTEATKEALESTASVSDEAYASDPANALEEASVTPETADIPSDNTSVQVGVAYVDTGTQVENASVQVGVAYVNTGTQVENASVQVEAAHVNTGTQVEASKSTQDNGTQTKEPKVKRRRISIEVSAENGSLIAHLPLDGILESLGTAERRALDS